jgi:hypothetical protein
MEARVSFEEVFGKIADRAMAKKRPAAQAPFDPWIYCRLLMGDRWLTYMEIAAIVGKSRAAVKFHIYAHPDIYERKPSATAGRGRLTKVRCR